jgi:hypothetical protein
MNMSAAQLLLGLLLAASVGCSPGETPQAQDQPRVGSTVEARINAIQAAAERIDSIGGGAADAHIRQLTAEAPHWQFSGIFEASTPILLNALFTEGKLVREETYYLEDGQPRLLRLARWWDVDDDEQAPEPATSQDFYIDGDQIIRHVVNVATSPPVASTDDSTRSAAALAARCRVIAQILLGTHDAALIGSLEMFPDEPTTQP